MPKQAKTHMCPLAFLFFFFLYLCFEMICFGVNSVGVRVMYFGTQVELINVYVKGKRNVDRNIRLNKCQIVMHAVFCFLK